MTSCGRFFVFVCDACLSVNCQGEQHVAGCGLPPGFQYKHHPANQEVQHACKECLKEMTPEQQEDYHK